MTYKTVAAIAQDGCLYRRILACAYIEQVADPPQWVADHLWHLAAQPGWAQAWESALVGKPADFQPGDAEDVISDPMILSAVQALNI